MSINHQAGKRRIAVGAVLSMVVTAAIALVLPAPRASADLFGGCYGAFNAQGCLPDDFNHGFCFSGIVNQNLRTAFTAAMANLDAQTRYFDTALTSCDNLTDVIVIQNVTLTSRGRYTCIISNAAGNCERGHIDLNPNNLLSPEDRVKTSCHEIGHSVGLKHGITQGAAPDNGMYLDCMRSGNIVNMQDFDSYDNHHVDHIDDRA
jgi:hypothetical protein